MKDGIVFDESYTVRSKDFGQEKREEMIKKLKEGSGTGYVR